MISRAAAAQQKRPRPDMSRSRAESTLGTTTDQSAAASEPAERQTGYLKVAQMANAINESTSFQAFITFVIVLAGVLVGLQTYPGMGDDPVLTFMDLSVLGVFIFEIILKTIGKGYKPWEYFTDPVLKYWNWFDFVIVVLCLVPGLGSSAAFLRILRLLRVLKLLKMITELQIILQGLAKGLASIQYIVMLLLLVFYLYGIMGMMFLGANDPWHFGTLPMTMVTLFRASTLEDWSDLMYIAYYGCDQYGYGGIEEQCTDPSPQPILALLFWTTFVVISALVMLSLFIGAITMGMQESIVDCKHAMEDAKMNAMLAMRDERLAWLRAQTDLSDNILQLWNNRDATTKGPKIHTCAARLFLQASRAAQRIVELERFQQFVIAVILLASVMVGLETNKELWERMAAAMSALETTILAIFTMECGLKILAQGFTPWRFFYESWNCFDFVIVVACFLPFGGSFVSVLRLLRLLRVLKLVRSLPQLQIIVMGLIQGFRSIGYIAILLFLVYYLFAIIAMALFQENDPWHFGSLHVSMMTLLRCSTLDDWTDVMYINMLGCDQYDDVATSDGNCTSPVAWGALSAIYFISFTVLASLVLMSLFIGVVTTSMDQASKMMEEEQKAHQQLELICEQYSIKPKRMDTYRHIFRTFDMDGSNSIDSVEFEFIMSIFVQEITQEDLQATLLQLEAEEAKELKFHQFAECLALLEQGYIFRGRTTFPAPDLPEGGDQDLTQLGSTLTITTPEENKDHIPGITISRDSEADNGENITATTPLVDRSSSGSGSRRVTPSSLARKMLATPTRMVAVQASEASDHSNGSGQPDVLSLAHHHLGGLGATVKAGKLSVEDLSLRDRKLLLSLYLEGVVALCDNISTVSPADEICEPLAEAVEQLDSLRLQV